MAQKKLRKLLQGKAEFNPFNDHFNYDELVSKLADEGGFESTIANSTPIFNNCFKELYKSLGEIVTRYDIASEVLMRLFLGVANNDYLALQKAFREQIKDEHHLEDLSSMRVPSPSMHIGDMNLIATFETIVDTLNVVINYLRFFADKEAQGSVQESDIRMDVLRFYGFSNIYYNMKNAYDTALWEDGYIDEEDGILYIRYIDEQYPINIKIGNFRLQKHIFSYLMTLEKALDGTLLSYSKAQLIKRSLMTKRKPVAISTVKVNSKGIISYTLTTDKKLVKINDYMKQGQASIVAYYPHFEDIKLPKLNNLSINDLLVLLAQLNELIAGIKEQDIDLESIALKQLAFRMQEANLIKYFLKTTFYSEKDIRVFLSLLVADGKSKKRITLWKTPLVKYKNTYYVCMSAIKAPNFLFLIDEWLEDGGYGIELVERGKLFERFVKNTANEKLIKKKIPFNIPVKDKYYNADNKYEEIDLIISFEDLLIVAELKNIKYPMEPRDYHNSLKRLREGAEQVIRKTDFLVHNKECFTEELGNIEEKEIVPLVLTNFSIFSGLKLNGVPVIDLVLLESYLKSGEYTRLRVELIENQATTTKQEVIKYFMNNDEFISNFPEFVNSPFPIQDLKDKAYVEDKVITLETAWPQIFIEIADFKETDPAI
ncbi:hypothetical protein [Metabacillus sp. FJAT-52054]|uniref:NERD domain-containing protein n=1 Tax=Metabacillus sediminis TaxID=3117746 RepID=A0ABZ2NHR6_9BACI